VQRRILLIDDDPNQHLIQRYILERENFTVLSAYDGPSGLQTLRESNPELILLDFMMPGMDGSEVLRAIHSDPAYEKHRQVPVIMLTAAIHEKSAIQEFLDRGLAVYLKKPFGNKELVEIIHNTLHTNAILVRDRTLFRAIQDSRDFLENLLDNCPALILTTDRNGVITYCNRMGETLAGLENSKLVGQPLSQYWKCASGEALVLLHGETTGAGDLQQQGDLAGTDGRLIPLAMTFTVLRNAKSVAIGLLAVGKDLTTLRELQKQTLENERLLGITEALATVNHEINNPLTPIIGNVQLLLTGTDALDAAVTQKLRSIEMNARKIHEIIQKMSHLSRPLHKQYYGDVQILDLQHSS
jgi:PAS domain S-box-containing protein